MHAVKNVEAGRIKKRKWKKFLIITFIGFVVVSFAGGFALTWSIYESTFGTRFDTDSDLDFYLNQKDFPDLEFEERSFPTDNGNELKAWLYHKRGTTLETNNFKALIVLSHGLGNGHHAYLPDIQSLAKSGYLVFAFDNTGCAESEGNGVKGFPQGVIDLGKALDSIEVDPNLNVLPIRLYGHSWGGYSVMNILHENHSIKAVIEQSGPSTSKAVFILGASQEVGKLSSLFEPFLFLTEQIKFGKIANYNAVDAVNNTDIPILLMHSKDDTLIPIGISPLTEKSSITNNKVQFKIFEDRGHDLLKSDRANEYQKQVFSDLKKLRLEYEEIPVSAKQEFMSHIDKEKFNEINPQIMDGVTDFFDDTFYK